MVRAFLILAFLAFGSTSCGGFARMVGVVTGWSRICVGGVSYLQFASGASVEYTQDGKVKTCKGE